MARKLHPKVQEYLSYRAQMPFEREVKKSEACSGQKNLGIMREASISRSHSQLTSNGVLSTRTTQRRLTSSEPIRRTLPCALDGAQCPKNGTDKTNFGQLQTDKTVINALKISENR